MSIAHLLEQFDMVSGLTSSFQWLDEETLEEHRLTAFERGYTAGWEDAEAARAREQSKAIDGLKDTLADVSFSYHEALSEMNRSLQPLFHSLVDKLLPSSSFGVRSFISLAVRVYSSKDSFAASSPH